jgi:flagellar hook assembly protein FlgD
MNKSTFNWLKKATIAVVITAFILPNLKAFAENEVLPEVKITENSVTSETINPEEGEKLELKYCLSAPSYVKTGIYEAIGSTSSEKVSILEDTILKEAGCYNLTWDGKNEGIVEDGKYFYGIQAFEVSEKSQGSDYKSQWIYVKTEKTEEDNLKIIDTEVENPIFDPWENDEAEITFVINQDSYITLEIRDEDNCEVKTLVEDKYYEKGEYAIEWDGEDKFGDIVSQGEYEYRLTAKNNNGKVTKKGDLIVKKGYEVDDSTVDPRLKNVFATKELFDPGRNETTEVVFTLTAKADVKVEIYNSNGDKIEEIMDADDLKEGTYIAEWDGYGYEGEKAKFTYKVYAKNSKGSDSKIGEIEIDEDYKDSKKPNVFKDKVNPIVYKPKNQNLDFSFKLDREAEVTIEIRDGDYVIAYVVEKYDMDEGSYTLSWNGLDKYGEYAENGVYKYKLIAGNEKGKDVETGQFVILETGDAKQQEGASQCGGFTDVEEGYKYCEAINWAKSENIFEGYSDGKFKPNQAINRVEALKVIIEAMGVNVIQSNGENLGFPDLERFDWYMPYLKTALSLGIVSGYPDGTFKPRQQVIRVEALVMMLNTGKAKHGIIIPTNLYGQPYYDTPNEENTKWYLSYVWFAKAESLTDNDYYFYPNSYMTRGEMADMLYRYHQAGLDK